MDVAASAAGGCRLVGRGRPVFFLAHDLGHLGAYVLVVGTRSVAGALVFFPLDLSQFLSPHGAVIGALVRGLLLLLVVVLVV